MQSAKETASNIAASAKAGVEKTKATAQEKAEKMTTRDPMKKELAEEKKAERIRQAELEKQAADNLNAAVKDTSTTTGTHGIGHTPGMGGTGTTGSDMPHTGGVTGTGRNTGGTGYTTGGTGYTTRGTGNY